MYSLLWVMQDLYHQPKDGHSLLIGTTNPAVIGGIPGKVFRVWGLGLGVFRVWGM